MWLMDILDSTGMDYACVISLEWATSLCLKIQPQLLYSFIQKKVSKKKKNKFRDVRKTKVKSISVVEEG